MFAYPPLSLQEFDRRIAHSSRWTLAELMESAGAAVADAAEEFPGRVLVVCGKGNNGGDGLVAARLLHQRGRQVQLLFTTPVDELNQLCRQQYEALPASLRENVLADFPSNFSGVVIDGILGTGFQGQLKPALQRLIKSINASKCYILSIDIPSGLDGKDGSGDLCVRADLTVTMVAPKMGMFRCANGIRATGRLVVAHLPGEELLGGLTKGPHCFGEEDARALMPRNDFDAHKYQRGCVTVIGGSEAYPGAPILAATGALYAGAGLVTAMLPKNATPLCAVPQALIVDKSGDQRHLKRAGALVVGPGMSTSEEARQRLLPLLDMTCPMVLDADALNLLATMPQFLSRSHPNWVLTPHEGEIGRLFAALKIAYTSDYLRSSTQKLAKALGCHIVLKGARTMVVAPDYADDSYTYNLSGCPALGTAGSGDVLSGVIGALLARGMAIPDAARLGVWLHGRAGELLSAPRGQFGLIADDLPAKIGELLRKDYIM